jgi:uncharacterized membrane protein
MPKLCLGIQPVLIANQAENQSDSDCKSPAAIGYLETLMRTTITLCLSVWAGSASAQSANLPELFKVVDVAQSDKLNIRSEPNATSDIVGTFVPGEQDIEVVAQSSDGSWSQVNSGDGAGWVASKFLAVQPQTWVNGQLPESLSCSGTEPFWSLSNAENKLSYQPMDGEEQTFGDAKIIDRNFEGDRHRVVLAGDGDHSLTTVIQPGHCSDGMSDRNYALSTTLIFQSKGSAPSALYGCCTISK